MFDKASTSEAIPLTPEEREASERSFNEWVLDLHRKVDDLDSAFQRLAAITKELYLEVQDNNKLLKEIREKVC